MTPIARKALMLGLGYDLLAMGNRNEMLNPDEREVGNHDGKKPVQRQSTLTPQQKKEKK